jgi:SGNH domain-containing protein
VIGCGLVVAASVGALAFVIVRTDGFPARVPASARAVASLDEMWRWEYRETLPFGGSTYFVVGAPWAEAQHRGVLWGDSHAEHFATVLDAPARKAGVSLLLYRTCAPFVSKGARRHHPAIPLYSEWCEERRDDLVRILRERRHNIGMLILAAAWASTAKSLVESDTDRKLALMQDGLDRLLAEISKLELHTLILADIPAWPSDSAVACLQAQETGLLRRPCPYKGLSRAEIDQKHGATNQILRSLGERWAVSVVMPADALCDDQRCRTHLNGEFLYRDAHHLRRNLAPETLKELAALLRLSL